MPRTTDDIDIIVPGESSDLAISSYTQLQGTDILWVGQSGGTVPKTVTLAQLRDYIRQGHLGTTSAGMFFPASATYPHGLAYILSTTKPLQRPQGLVPEGVTTALQSGDRWYDTNTGIEWVRRGNYWIQPLEELHLQSLMQSNPYCFGGTAWVNESADRGSGTVSELAGLTGWLQNPHANGIFLEYMAVRYFTPRPVLEGGYSYTCWIENVNNAMVPQSYFYVANTFADMTLPPNNPVVQGSASVSTQTPLQTINWVPVSNTAATQAMALVRSNTVTYTRQLYVPSNSIRITMKDFQARRGQDNNSPTALLIGATLYFHWTV